MAAPPGGSRAHKTSKPAFSDDQIQLSGLMAQLSRSGAPDHLARLAELGDVVSRGQYQVDAGVVSDAIIRERLAVSGAY
jgi:anti-sigma28 factor (negative regulator of flagellin synthesis)